MLHWDASDDCNDDESYFVKAITTAGHGSILHRYCIGLSKKALVNYKKFNNLFFCAPPAILTNIKILSVA